MKAIFFLTKVCLAFFIGAVVAMHPQLGFNPIASGFTTVGVFMIGAAPKGALANGIDLTDFNTQLNTYIQRNMTNIWYQIRTGFELAPFLTRIPNVTGEYAHISTDTTELIQGFQSAWTPKGTVNIDAYKGRARHLKIDMLIDNIDSLWNGWLDFLCDETRLRSEWPFVKWVVQYELIPKAIEELNMIACKGVYVAPTPGTPGASINSADGFLTLIATEITAGNLVPIVTGAVDRTNAVERVETFLDGVDPDVMAAIEMQGGGDLLVSLDNERNYKYRYRALFGAYNDPASKNQTKVDMYNIRVRGIQGFGSSDRFMLAPKGNLLHLHNKVALPDRFETQLDKRDVCLLGDWFTGFSFGTLNRLYVNDQA